MLVETLLIPRLVLPYLDRYARFPPLAVTTVFERVIGFVQLRVACYDPKQPRRGVRRAVRGRPRLSNGAAQPQLGQGHCCFYSNRHCGLVQGSRNSVCHDYSQEIQSNWTGTIAVKHC
jgi:hypothetical protein